MNFFRIKTEQLYDLLSEQQGKLKNLGFIRIKYVGCAGEEIYNQAKEEYEEVKSSILKIEKEIKCRLKY